MRFPIFVCVLALVGCGNDSVDQGLDSPAGNRPDPRVIPGGGIGDGAIDGVVNLYVIDDASRDPIADAEVRVGTTSGTTDATGLFIAEGLVGPQDIVVKASAHRQEVWLGANGANMTVNLEADLEPTPQSANLSGTIPNLVTAALPPNHAIVATISYSQVDDLGDPANEIAQPIDPADGLPQNICFSILVTDTCPFTVTSRTGKVALIATIIDNDSKGTPDGNDDTQTFVGIALLQGLVVSSGVNQTVTMPAKLPAAMLQTVTVSFGTPPASTGTRFGVVSMELGDEGVLPVGFVAFADPTLQAPKLAAVSGATGYRLIGLAGDGAPTDPKQSVVLRRELAGPTLAAGTWLDPPTGVTLSKSSGTWTNTSGATVHSIELKKAATAVLNVTVFDSSKTSFTVPDLITLPSGSLEATLNAIGATDFDVNDFEIDRDRNKLDRVAGQAKTIPN